MISEPGIDRDLALSMLANVASKPKRDRNQIAKLYQSEDEQKQTLAKTRAAALPPPLPDYFAASNGVVIELKKWARFSKGSKFERDVRALVDQCDAICETMREEYQTFKEEEMKK